MNFVENVENGDNVLLIWNTSVQQAISDLVNELRNKKATVSLENSEMLTEQSRPKSSFNIIISNWLPPHSVNHSDYLLSIIIKLLRPSGKLILKDASDLSTTLKLNGFINVTRETENVYRAEKPKFEVGSKASLKLNSKPTVWKLDNTIESAWLSTNDEEIIDDNQLLDEDDLKKPDQESLRVCSTTGKRKACADCSCGLAEELRGETKDTPKSSCGSCYLGDAFRCSTCPYLGMPAFKPGEKVLLDLKSDI